MVSGELLGSVGEILLLHIGIGLGTPNRVVLSPGFLPTSLNIPFISIVKSSVPLALTFGGFHP